MKTIIIAIAILAGLPTPRGRAEDAQRSLLLVGQSGNVTATQEVDNAIVIGGSLLVEGTVHGAAAAIGGDVEVRAGAVIEEGVYTIGGNLRIADGARVEGARTQVAAGRFGDVVDKVAASRKPHDRFWVGPLLLAQVAGALVLCLVLTLVAPHALQVVRRTLEREPRKVALTGAALMLGFVPGCVILALSLFGIPLIPLALVLLVAIIVTGLTALAASLGYRWFAVKHPGHLTTATAFGMLVIAIASMLPVVGGLLWLLAGFYGAGAVIVSRFGTRKPDAPQAVEHRPQRDKLADVATGA